MSTAHQPLPKKNGHDGGYEKQDVGFRFAMVFVSALIVSVVVVLVFLIWFYRVFLPIPANGAASTTASARRLPPAPVLQANPVADMQRFRAEEQRKVSTYGWMDERQGIARIPVDRAMELVLQNGLPQWQSPSTTQEKTR